MTAPRVIDWEAEYERQRGGQGAAPAATGPVDWEAEYAKQQRATLPSLAPVVVNANPPALDAGTLPPAVVSDTALTPKPNRYLAKLTARPLPKVAPGVPAVLPEETRVGADQYPGHYQPGAIERGLTLPLRMAAEAGEHPLDFSTGLVAAPIHAAITANRAAAEQQARNDIGMAGGKLGEETAYGQLTGPVERTVTPREAAVASLQLGATLAAPIIPGLLSNTARALAVRAGASETGAALAGRVAGAVAHPVASGAALASFTPNDPVAGFIGGALLGTPWSDAADASLAAAQRARPRVAQLYQSVKNAQQSLRAEPGAGTADAQASLSRVVAGLDEKDLAYAAHDPAFGEVFRNALEQRGVQMPPAPDILRGHLEQLNASEATRTASQPDPSFAANVDRSVAGMAEAHRQQAVAANPPQPPEPFTEKPLPTTPSVAGPVSASHLIDYADTHDVPVMTAARAFQQAGHDVPDAVAKNAITQSLARDEPPTGAGDSDIEVATRLQNAIASAADRQAFPIATEHLLAHSEAKGTTIPESADMLRANGYSVSPELERAAQMAQMRRGETNAETPTPDEIRAKYGETFSDQRQKAIGSPPVSVEHARTGEPFRAKLLRGIGREGSPYNPLGGQVPLLGEGRYTTPDRQYAQEFGPAISEHTVELRNPLVIDNDQQWRELTHRAGWEYPNPFGKDPLAVEGDIARLRSMIEQQGHDGVVVKVPEDEATGKTLQHVFGASQAVEFRLPKKATIATRPPREKGIVLDEDGVQRFSDARSMSGRLRPIERVATDGLIDELSRIDAMQEGAEGRSRYNYTQDENLHSTEDGRTVISATRIGGKGVSQQAKALTNLEDFRRRRDAIYEELQRRGLDHESIFDRFSVARDRAEEREGLARDAPKVGRPDDFVTDEGGNVLFSPDREIGDLFGRAGPASRQEGLFSEREGTPGPRNLEDTEAASRAELDGLRQRQQLLDAPSARGTMQTAAERIRVSQRIAELEKLVNRSKAITPNELTTRAEAEKESLGVGTEHGPDQGALFSPAGQPTPIGQRLRQALGFKLSQSGPVIERVKSLGEISRNLADMVDVPLRQGRFLAKQRRAVGAFFPDSEVARVTRFDKIDTAAHEVAHYISKEYLKNPTMGGAKGRGAPALTSQMKAELVKMGKDLYGNRKPAGGYGEEGIAQWGRFYVTDPARLASDAPAFSGWMDQHVLAKEPALKAAMDQAQRDFADYSAAPVTAQVDAMISVRPEWRGPINLRSFARSVLDDLTDIRQAVNDLGGAKTPTQDAYVLARLTRGAAGMAEEMVERGVVNPRTGQRVTKGLAEILEQLKPDDVQPFRRYLTAERALELHARGIDSGITVPQARAIVQMYEPAYRALAEHVWKISHALIDYREAKGLLTSDEARQIKDKNQRRVGFYRVFDDDESAPGRGTGRGLLRNTSGVKSIKGSSRQIIDPLQSLIADHYETVKQSHAAEVGLALADMAEHTEGGGRVVEILTENPKRMVRIPVEQVKDQLAQLGFLPPNGGLSTMSGMLEAFENLTQGGARESKDLVLPVVRNGRRVWLQIGDKPLYDALQGLGTPEMPLALRMLSIPTRVLRAGATLTAEFIGRNPIRDAWGAAIFSRAGFRPPGFNFARGLFHAVQHDELYQDWRLSGGDNAAMLGVDRSSSIWPKIARTEEGWSLEQRTQSERALTNYLRSPAQRAAGWVFHPIDSLRMVSSLFENATRIGEYAGVHTQALARGASRADAKVEASLASRDVTIDFARAGAQARIANQLVAFLNANIQGLDKLGRELRERPHVVLPRIAAAITVPSIALYLLQRHDPAYQEVPTWQKNLAWVVVQRDHEGNVAHIWRIPKPPELGILFGSIPERVLEWMDTRDPRALDGIAQSLTNLNPFHLPDALQPLVEAWANKNTFTGRKIVPDALTNLPPSEQATQYTGDAAREVGGLLNVSPAKFENTVRGYTGGLGQYGLDLANYGVRATRSLRGEEPLAPAAAHAGDPLTRVPLLRGVTIRNPQFDAESIQRTANDFAEADALHHAWRRKLEGGDHTGAADYLAQHHAQIMSVATKEEGGPGPLRAAYEAIARDEQTAAKGGRILHNTTRALDLSNRMAGQALGIARRYREANSK